MSFPEMVRTKSGLGEVRYALVTGSWIVIWSSWQGRARPNTLRAVAFDLKTFFTVIVRDPVEVIATLTSPADV